MSAVGHSAREVLKDSTTQNKAAGVDTVVSIRSKLTHEDSFDLRIDAVASSVSGACNMVLETAYTKDGPWFAAKSVALVNGSNELKITKHDAGDVTYLPLRSQCRIVITGAGSCDIDSLRKSERR